MLAMLAEFQVPPFRFLQTVNGLVSPDGSEVQPLHVVVGELDIAEDKAIVLIQTNIDDMSSQLLSYVINRLFEAGALDVYQMPIYMKKNRVGIRLNVVVRQRDEIKLANLILRETTTLGVNVRPLHHNYHAEVQMVEVETKYGTIPVKQKYLDGVLLQSKPEYEVTAKIASTGQVSMDELHNEIVEQLKLKNRRV
jgi:pyridinium-3,5-bisthiocarboxylic acid mononucleotide nickel chelatase